MDNHVNKLNLFELTPDDLSGEPIEILAACAVGVIRYERTLMKHAEEGSEAAAKTVEKVKQCRKNIIVALASRRPDFVKMCEDMHLIGITDDLVRDRPHMAAVLYGLKTKTLKGSV